MATFGFDSSVGKIPWRRERLPTPVFWPGEFNGVAKKRTRLRNFHFPLHIQILFMPPLFLFTNTRVHYRYTINMNWTKKDTCCSVTKSCLTLWPGTAAHQASLSFTISGSLLQLMSIESVMPSNHLILCCPLLNLPSIFPSIRVFSNELALCIRLPKYWSFSFSINPSNGYSGLISFGIDWVWSCCPRDSQESSPAP